MRRFVAAMAFALMLTAVNLAEAATPFTNEQIDKMFSITVQNPAAEDSSTLPIDSATFQRNFNAFMMNFINDVSSGEESKMLQEIFLLNNASVTEHDEGIVFSKNFLNRAAVVGLSDGGNFKVLNLFAAQLDDRDDALFNVLILQAFVRSISPDFDAMTLLRRAKKNPTAPIIHNGVNYTITKTDNLNIVTAVAE